MGYFFGFELCVAAGGDDKRSGVLPGYLTDCLTTFFIGQFGYRTSIDHANVCFLSRSYFANAVFFENFSTFVGRTGLYLEDLFVLPEARGKGIGKKLFQAVAQEAVNRGCQRMEWTCLDWNQPSIEFYLRMGAVPMSEWTNYRLSGDAIAEAVKK